MDQNYKKLLEKQGYKFAGDHSVVKMCGWTKKALKGEGTCYKQKFYGINSHRCVQMSPSANQCFMNCVFCWRDRNESPFSKIDDPEKIIDGSICAQHQILTGMKGNIDVTMEKYLEALDVKHFAISLTGEPTAYPKISEFIAGLHKRGISSFVVTNGMFPETLRKMTRPSQLYVSLDAPTKELFEKIDLPDLKDAWDRLMRTMDFLKEIRKETRTVLRITAVKEMNMDHHDDWAKIIKRANPLFVEVKGFMLLGASRDRLTLKNSPTHEEIREFAKEIAKHCGYKYIDEQIESRVVLLMQEDSPDRFFKWEWVQTAKEQEKAESSCESGGQTLQKKLTIPIVEQ